MSNKDVNLEDKSAADSLLEKNKKSVDYDDVLSAAGEFGLYQVILFLSTFPFYLFGVFVYFSQLFMTQASSEYWCWIPELENLTVDDRKSLAIPTEINSDFPYSRCQAYIANWTDILNSNIRPNSSWPTESCQNGWEFNKTEIPYPTITSDLGWVCEKDSYQATAQSVFFAGSIFGCLGIGWISDHYGRLPGAVISNMIACIAGIISTYARNFYEFTACRFVLGLADDSCVMMIYLLVLEYVAPKYRTLFSSLAYSLFYAPSAVVLPWIALACGHWKTFSLVTSVPMVITLLTPLVLPESPRWLLSKGRVDDAIVKVLRIAKVNKKQVPPELIQNFRETVEKMEEEENTSVIDLLRRPKLRKLFIFMCIIFGSTTVIFDALVRTIGQLKFDYFVSFSLISATEFPSLLIAAFVMDIMGRRWLSVLVLLLCAIFSIATAFLGGGLPSVICTILARFCINIGLSASIQWIPELLPTAVRATGSSLVHIIGNMMAILSPYIVYLETYVSWLPLVIIAVIAALGALTALALPETANVDMPQTFDQAEGLIEKQRLFDVPFLKSGAPDSDIQPSDHGEECK